MVERAGSSEFQILPPLSRYEYIDSLNVQDKANLNLLEELLRNQSPYSERLSDGVAGLFVVGSSAIPRQMLRREPNDIDLRIVLGSGLQYEGFKGGWLSNNFDGVFHDWSNLEFTLRRDITLVNLGDHTFHWRYEENMNTNSPFVRFNPNEGKQIDLFLPFISSYEQSLDSFEIDLDFFRQGILRGLLESSAQDREDLFKQSYSVRLI